MSEFNTKIKFRSWDEYNLSEDAAFDKYALDVEAEKQSMLMQKWLELLASSQAELSKAKEALLNKEASLFLKAKTGGTTSLGAKPTDATVKAWVHTQPEYRKAQRRKRKAENDVQYLQNARTVLEHKKSMLKIESDLWICGYFSRPLMSKKLDSNSKEQQRSKLKESLEKRHKRRITKGE